MISLGIGRLFGKYVAGDTQKAVEPPL